MVYFKRYAQSKKNPHKYRYRHVQRLARYPKPYYARRSVQTYCQSFLSPVATTASTDMLIAHKVQFSQLPNYADFQKLFQQYKILKYLVKWVPTHNCYDPNNGTALINVPMFVATDYDQDATPTISELLKFQNVRTYQLNRGFTQMVYPMTTYTGSSTNELKRRSSSVWIDTTNADQYHNGIDIAIPQAAWDATVLEIGYVVTKVWFQVRYLDGTAN